VSSYNDRVITEFRDNHGRVQGYGDRLVLIHSRGVKSGESRVSPALALRDGDDWLVIASAGGAPRHPGWYFNLVANPAISIETGAEQIEVTAHQITGDDYPAAFARFDAVSPAFRKYQDRAGNRLLPIFRLVRR
jgi:deazaflavin-dependent oxidoreductase (nitroreductase family)